MPLWWAAWVTLSRLGGWPWGVRSLGVHLDPTLTMETQVASVVRTTFFHLWRIARLRPYLDTRALTTLLHVLYMGLPLKLM